VKIGRNERCPCGSGLKYKHCNGLPGRGVDTLPDDALPVPSADDERVSRSAPSSVALRLSTLPDW
jgi:hypothetical protein